MPAAAAAEARSALRQPHRPEIPGAQLGILRQKKLVELRRRHRRAGEHGVHLAAVVDVVLEQMHWADYRLLEACAKLNEADYRAQRVSFFPSIELTLNHILSVDELRREQNAADRRLIRFCEQLDDDRLVDRVILNRPGGRHYRERTQDALLRAMAQRCSASEVMADLPCPAGHLHDRSLRTPK
jgi:hypothetical protein